MQDDANWMDDIVARAPVTVLKTVQIFGIYDKTSSNPTVDRSDGSCRDSGTMIVEEMSDASWREASGAGYLVAYCEMLGGYEVQLVSSSDGLIFWPLPGELVKCGMVSDWDDAAREQGNLRRASALKRSA